MIFKFGHTRVVEKVIDHVAVLLLCVQCRLQLLLVLVFTEPISLAKSRQITSRKSRVYFSCKLFFVVCRTPPQPTTVWPEEQSSFSVMDSSGCLSQFQTFPTGIFHFFFNGTKHLGERTISGLMADSGLGFQLDRKF